MKYMIYLVMSFAVVALMLSAVAGPAYAQRELRVGSMWDEIGNDERGGWGGKAMAFPGGFWPSTLVIEGAARVYQKSTTPYHGHTMGLRNFTNKDGAFMPFAVAQATIQSAQVVGYDRIAMDGTKLTWQQQPPTVIVDGQTLTGENVDFVNPDLKADAMVEVTWGNILGITGNLKAYAYVNRDFDDFVIRDYTFTNSGNADGDLSTIELPNQDAEGFYFSVDFWPMDRAEGGSAYGHAAEWGGDAYVEYYGGFENENRYVQWVESGGAEGDSLRIMYGWDGDKMDGVDDAYDPSPFAWDDGRLMSAKYPGIAVLHADRASNDTEDWIQQPVAFRALGFVPRPNRTKVDGDEGVYRFDLGGDNNPTLDTQNPWYDVSVWQMYQLGRLSGTPDPNATSEDIAIGIIGSLTVGPYAIPFGEDVRIVLCYAVGGMDYERTVEIGAAYKRGDISKAEKDAICAAYRDSLFKNVSMAGLALERGYDIPDPPPSPDLTVTSGPQRIDISWSDVSGVPDRDTGVNDFVEYRLYRAQGSFWGNMPFELIYRGTQTSYTDTDVIRGFSYYYYVTAVDDGSQNWLNGKHLESGMHHNRTSVAAVPFRAPTEPLEEKVVRAVPNPWDASDLTNKYGPPGSEDFKKIRFINIPSTCEIRIYTEAGDLLKTIQHGGGATLPSGDEFWDQITDWNQEVVAGIYIAVIDSDQGTDVLKLVLIK